MDQSLEILKFSLPQLLVPIGFLVYARLKGQRAGSAYFLLLGLYFIFQVWVPVSDRLLGIHSFFGYRYPIQSILHWDLSRVYSLGLAFLTLAYALARGWWASMPDSKLPRYSAYPLQAENLLMAIQLLIWGLILFNLYASGIKISQLLNLSNRDEQTILFSAEWQYPWIDTLSNVLPVCLYLQHRYAQKINARLFLFFSVWFIFSLLAGWRYRIILCFLFFFLPWLSRQNLLNVRFGLILLTGLLFFSWLTLNRMAIAKRQFDLVTFRIWEMDISAFNMEFSNSRTFRATLQYLEKHPENQTGGHSWVEYISNRFRPKAAFENAERPKPWILRITKAWIPPGWPWNPNPAVTQLEEFFLTFGWPGLLLSMCLLGFWAAWLDLRASSLWLQNMKWVLIALLFQWTTRGFFLFQLQITLACLLPFLVLGLALPYLPHARNSSHPTGPV